MLQLKEKLTCKNNISDKYFKLLKLGELKEKQDNNIIND